MTCAVPGCLLVKSWKALAGGDGEGWACNQNTVRQNAALSWQGFRNYVNATGARGRGPQHLQLPTNGCYIYPRL
jgi:hypothetical protein